jgi:hypothetical protein
VVAVNLEAIFFALVLPGEVVGGVVRWDRISRHTGDRTGALTLIAAERLIDWMLLALVAAVGAPILFTGEAAPRLQAYMAAASGAVVVLGCVAILVGRSQSSLRAVEAWRAQCRPRVGAWVERLARLLGAVRALSGDTRRTAAVLLWTVAFWCMYFAGSVAMARAVFPQMPVLPYVAATAALALLVQVPFTVAGVGLRELSLPALLGAYGVTSELGLLVGLSAFVPYVFLGSGGLVLRLIGRARLAEEPPPPQNPGEPAN